MFDYPKVTNSSGNKKQVTYCQYIAENRKTLSTQFSKEERAKKVFNFTKPGAIALTPGRPFISVIKDPYVPNA